jgi:hypothetical protein
VALSAFPPEITFCLKSWAVYVVGTTWTKAKRMGQYFCVFPGTVNIYIQGLQQTLLFKVHLSSLLVQQGCA